MVEALSVATITVLAVISPGADFAMVTRNSMVISRRAGVLTAVGIALGVLVHVAYSMAGIGLLLARSAVLFNAVKLAGAAYLIYLGVGMLCAQPTAPAARCALAEPVADGAALKTGFLTNALNPKTTLFVVALFAQVISPATPFALQLAYGLFMSLAHLFWFSLVACAFSSDAARRLVASFRHWVERSVGAVLVVLGLSLAAASLHQ